ncbi:hypothetical protein CSB37_03555 [bacterium DOLZORAL124_38_8]|nr:MAG: hypothetical protein CSB37_03555 [bacterium DOLZORAL124_38_8]
MKKETIQNLKKNIAFVFLALIVPFVVLAVLSIWDFVGADVIWKSVSTISVLAVATLLAVGVLALVNDKK